MSRLLVIFFSFIDERDVDFKDNKKDYDDEDLTK